MDSWYRRVLLRCPTLRRILSNTTISRSGWIKAMPDGGIRCLCQGVTPVPSPESVVDLVLETMIKGECARTGIRRWVLLTNSEMRGDFEFYRVR